MSWSLNIGTIAGTAVRVHITFLLFLGWIFFASYVAEGPEDAVASLLFMLLLFACVLAHESAHIFTARAFASPRPMSRCYQSVALLGSSAFPKSPARSS